MTDNDTYLKWCADMGLMPKASGLHIWQAAIAHAQQERKPDEWAPYLKDGETPFERFKRERADLDALMTLYRRTLEAQKERKPHTEAEVQELRHASYYTVELGDFEATVRRILGVPAP